MKNQYQLSAFNGEPYKYVSFSVDYSRPEEYLSDVAKELARKKFEGYVLFDLLLCNGLNSQRYVKSYFNGNTFQQDSFIALSDKELDESVKQFTFKFYSSKNELLENSNLLSRAQKFLVRKGFQ
ncbi:MAG: hypothetical protein HOP02_11345 [Methylococcaceae bacterium]|nr:hypothetical protein [Methylococcaceae bacterium]